ncbi:MAG TPA: hypothetical protein VFF78_03550, partial [Anaerolineaceae bacterium]|nr:hypothetical protein [Anaerolineaceae bacterium]
SQWIRVPDTNYDLATILLEKGLKYSGIYRPSRWIDRTFPPPYLEATDDPQRIGTNSGILMVDGLGIIKSTENQYAAVSNSDGSLTACQATAIGGNIDVKCSLGQPGILRVYENNWDGWGVRVDGVSSTLITSDWLEVEIPAGEHFIEFRYRPWDVWLGLAISLIGIGLATWVIKRKNDTFLPISENRRLTNG